MREERRIRMFAGMLLGMTALCSAALFAGAGENAVKTFAPKAEVNGMENAAVQAAAQIGALNGLTVAVDAGHGGYDGGAVGRVSGVPEKGINLDVALRVQELLEE